MPRHTREHLEQTRLEKSSERYTVKGMVEDEFYNLVHLERRKFFYTAWDLTIRPAKAINMVLAGHKRYLYPYFNYLLLIGAITIFLSVRYKFFVTGFEIGDQSGLAGQLLDWMGFNTSFRQAFFVYAEQFTTIVNIVAIPFFCFFSWLLFAKTRLNLAEHFILNVYIAAQQLFFLWFFIPFLELFPTSRDITIGVYTVLSILYNIWVYTSVFVGKTWLKILKSGIAIGLAFFVQTPFNYLVFSILQPFTQWLDKLF